LAARAARPEGPSTGMCEPNPAPATKFSIQKNGASRFEPGRHFFCIENCGEVGTVIQVHKIAGSDFVVDALRPARRAEGRMPEPNPGPATKSRQEGSVRSGQIPFLMAEKFWQDSFNCDKQPVANWWGCPGFFKTSCRYLTCPT